MGTLGVFPKEKKNRLRAYKREKRWCSTLEGRIRRRKIKVSIGSDGVSRLRVEGVGVGGEE